MKIKQWAFICSAIFGIGAVVGYVVNEFEVAKTRTSKQVKTIAQDTEPRAPKTMVEIISDQIETGNASCPKDNLLTYETCLLFQGALGTWQRIGLRESCPVFKDLDIPTNIKVPRSSPPGQKDEPAKISRKDVERAINTPCFGYLYSISVANIVPVLVSTANMTFQMSVVSNFSKPGSDPEICLNVRHGICGNHAAVAIAFFTRAGFKSRAVEFYYEYEGERHSHITPEVLIDNHYRLIDSTYGAYWVDPKPGSSFELMPTDRVLAGKSGEPFYNVALLPYGFKSVIGNSFSSDIGLVYVGGVDLFKILYGFNLTDKRDVIRGGIGKISIDLRDDIGRENFQHKPNFVGDNKSDGLTEGITFEFDAVRSQYLLTITISGASFSDTSPAFVCIDDSCEQFSTEKKEYRFTVENPSKLHLKATSDVAYAVIKSLDWEAVNE